MNIVAVCACPSGVAHTYMACEGLECAAKKRKASIKVETQGAMGIENAITAAEVAAADFVILTNDVKIRDVERFSGKPVYYISSNDAIRKSEKIIENIVTELGIA
ncbi:PTS fructose transporter subunit IIB [Pelolinea submarina]|jgi:fructose-specific phosphotransferase system IIB component|uniref:PTS system IIB component (Fru family) n=1 Tax=Pelolinea submarina TaxID=913107 RepID=A0A347ZNY4_9CHLR|nr:fructose PTS transporter subunit IIB [Pelolinea submarina]REG08618.1 PTS system IIB component (Fru family) [Pelolinea submarina]BBB47015.1 PTS system, fructose-specific IIB-like component [Pelolinea submarina]